MGDRASRLESEQRALFERVAETHDVSPEELTVLLGSPAPHMVSTPRFWVFAGIAIALVGAVVAFWPSGGTRTPRQLFGGVVFLVGSRIATSSWRRRSLRRAGIGR